MSSWRRFGHRLAQVKGAVPLGQMDLLPAALRVRKLLSIIFARGCFFWRQTLDPNCPRRLTFGVFRIDPAADSRSRSLGQSFPCLTLLLCASLFSSQSMVVGLGLR